MTELLEGVKNTRWWCELIDECQVQRKFEKGIQSRKHKTEKLERSPAQQILP